MRGLHYDGRVPKLTALYTARRPSLRRRTQEPLSRYDGFKLPRWSYLLLLRTRAYAATRLLTSGTPYSALVATPQAWPSRLILT